MKYKKKNKSRIIFEKITNNVFSKLESKYKKINNKKVKSKKIKIKSTAQLRAKKLIRERIEYKKNKDLKMRN